MKAWLPPSAWMGRAPVRFRRCATDWAIPLEKSEETAGFERIVGRGHDSRKAQAMETKPWSLDHGHPQSMRSEDDVRPDRTLHDGGIGPFW
jgi:hypothetical protein